MFKSKKKLEKITKMANEILETQGQGGNYNKDTYMTGLYNGIEYVLSLLEEREPKYVDCKWINYRGRCRKITAKELIEEKEREEK